MTTIIGKPHTNLVNPAQTKKKNQIRFKRKLIVSFIILDILLLSFFGLVKEAQIIYGKEGEVLSFSEIKNTILHHFDNTLNTVDQIFKNTYPFREQIKENLARLPINKLIEEKTTEEEDLLNYLGAVMGDNRIPSLSQLELTTKIKPPLTIHSAKLISNLNAEMVGGYTVKELALSSDLENLSIDTGNLTSGTFGGSGDYTFPSNLTIGGGQLYLSPISSGTETEGSLYFDSDNSKLYTRAGGVWVDLTQQNSSNTYTAGNGLTLSSKQFSISSNAITDTMVINTITASDYMPLAGGAFTNNVTFDGSSNLYFANGTTYYIDSSGHGKFNNLEALGTISLPNNSITNTMVSDDITASNYLLLSGGTLIGTLNLANGTTYYIDNSGHAKFNNLTAVGTISLPNNSITNAMVVDTITASNYMPLAGGTFTDSVTFDASSNLYFANGTTYYVDLSGHASFNNLNLAGNVGIGTTNPDAKLEVAGTGWLRGAIGTTGLYVNSSGSVGIGTTNPSSTLEVIGEIRGTRYAFQDDTDTYLDTIATDTLTLYTGDTERLTVNSSGNVGIGTTDPQQKLDINGNATISGTLALAPQVQAYAGVCDTSNEGKMYYDASENAYYYCDGSSWTKIGAGIDGSGTTNYLPKWSNSSTLANSTIYETGGSIGIGTTDPSYKLDVSGDINFTGALREDGVEILSGMISAFTGACPTGWTEYTAARGRTIVGTPSGGTGEGTQGTALTNLGTRTITDVPSHLHSVDPPNTTSSTAGNHRHSFTSTMEWGAFTAQVVAGYMMQYGTSYTSYAGDHSHTVDIAAFNSASTGTASVDVTMPYIQLTYCKKNAGADLAEWIPASEDISSATIVSIDPDNREKVIVSKKAYDSTVVGIVATQPGWIIGDENSESVQMALAGRVPTRVSLMNGEIQPGDAITTSPIPGVGMKATKAGSIVGKAMEALNETSSLENCLNPETGIEEQCGTLLTFVNISWSDPTNIDSQADTILARSSDEYYELMRFQDDLEEGDVVNLEYDQAPNQENPNILETVSYLSKAANIPNTSKAIGVISNNINGKGDLLRRERVNNQIISETRLILSGNVPLKIASSSGSIQAGDPLVLSEVSGMAMKANKVGPTMAKALEAWEPSSNKTKIMAFVAPGWNDPDVYLSSTGELNIENAPSEDKETKNKYILKDFFDKVINKIGAFAELATANLKAGRIESEQINTQRISLSEINSKSGEDIAINLQQEASESALGKLVIKGKEGQEVASIDAEGNVSFSGKLKTESLQIEKSADIAENYHVNDESIEAGDVVKIKEGLILEKTSISYDENTMGVISEKPAIILSSEQGNRALALSGRVLVKIASESAEIKIGDFLTSSSEPGKAIKAEQAGPTIGKALESWTPEVSKEKILIFVNLSYYPGDFLVNNILSVNSDDILNDINLEEDVVIENNLNVLGKTIVSEIGIIGNISAGLIAINGLEGAIDTLSEPLKLQNLALGNLEIMSGKVIIDTKGNLEIKEGIILGNSSFRDEAILSTDQTTIRIEKTWEKAPAIINTTPSYNTNIWVTEINNSGFTINVDISPPEEKKIYWLAIW